MTKSEIQKRHHDILEEMDQMECLATREERAFTDAEARKYDSLVREDNMLHSMIQGMLDEHELEKFREQKSKSAQLREFLQNCVKTRSNASTILLNPVTEGGDQNNYANIDASGAIPLTIREIIDTKVAGLELPADLAMVTGVIGNEIWPYATNDVQFTVAGEVEAVSEQALNFAKISAIPNRVAASVAVSHRAIDNAAFDLLGFITYKFQKGWAILKALHVYSHCNFSNDLKSPFASVTPVELTVDENIGKNLAMEIAEMYDLGFEGVPYLTMDKVTETELSYTKAIPGTAGDRTVVEDGRCVGYPYTVSPYVNYSLDGGVPKKEANRYIAIGHYGYLALQQHGELRFNVDAQSSANFDRGTVVLGMSTDMSLTELSGKVNGANGTPQAFKLIKLIEPASSSSI